MAAASSSSSARPSKSGMLIVGIGGNNGVTLLAGLIANRRQLTWETSAHGPMAANWNGCISQIDRFAHRYPLMDATTSLVVGGWDIRETPLGEALYNCKVLEYDLVRQVREEMNEMTFWPGVYNADFVGTSQHVTAKKIVDQATLWDQVQHLRKDIRTFRDEHKIDGHITVIWSASVERPADVEFRTAKELLDAIKSNTGDISPSILYATAAALEGCSFVNGGSQNTLSDGLGELFDRDYRKTLEEDVITSPAYLLGTDFKAGQTKFKTAAVEYLRSLGLKPKVLASSNHLGNNDMYNLTSPATLNAKMRVKKDIFAPWTDMNDVDHQVKVMYVPWMGDEKRDVVEYTSLGFLSHEHTMLTYTRCMDSILCVPLMIDVWAWCEFFARNTSSAMTVGRATAYLFKIPEGTAAKQHVDPGFFAQMRALERELQNVGRKDGDGEDDLLSKGVAAGIITAEQAEALRKMS